MHLPQCTVHKRRLGHSEDAAARLASNYIDAENTAKHVPYMIGGPRSISERRQTENLRKLVNSAAVCRRSLWLCSAVLHSRAFSVGLIMGMADIRSAKFNCNVYNSKADCPWCSQPLTHSNGNVHIQSEQQLTRRLLLQVELLKKSHRKYNFRFNSAGVKDESFQRTNRQ